jgi:hypothetical protein
VRSGGRHMNRVARISGLVTRFGPIVLPIGVAAIGVTLVVLGAT